MDDQRILSSSGASPEASSGPPRGEEAPRRYFAAEDLPAWVATAGGQRPGAYPYVRGIHPRMYTDRPWRMRQYAGFGTAAETNRRWKQLLQQGQHGVSCAFDLPTQLGLDSDDPRAAADAGRLGVAIDTLDDFVGLFEGIPLESTAATFNVNASAAVIYAMLLETAERQGADPARLTGTLSNDPLIEFVARGLWRVPPAGALRLMADTFEYSLRHTPGFYPMNLRATLVYEAGGTRHRPRATNSMRGSLDRVPVRRAGSAPWRSAVSSSMA